MSSVVPCKSRNVLTSYRTCTAVFGGLNIVRLLSIVSLILVFSSTIFVMANNIKAVNAFEANKGDSDMENCDYIEYVVPLSALP